MTGRVVGRRGGVQAVSWIAEGCEQTPTRMQELISTGCVTAGVLTRGMSSRYERFGSQNSFCSSVPARNPGGITRGRSK